MIPKYKVWDKVEKRMWNVETLFIEDEWVKANDGSIYGEHKDIVRSFELLQSTGLKDKNGVEIYEGDILEIPVAIDTETLNCEVVFEDGVFGIKDVLYGWGFENGLVTLIDIILAKKVIIIGNKYEHPHLLEE